MHKERLGNSEINISHDLSKKENIRKERLNSREMELCLKALADMGVKIA